MAISPVDPELRELVEFFLDELARRVREMDEAWRDADWERLRHIAHQLNGAGAAYGFANISESAAQLEQCLRAPHIDTAQISTKLQALIDLCQSVRK